MKHTHLFILTLLCIIGSHSAHAHNHLQEGIEKSDTVTIYFHQGKYYIYPELGDNQKSFSHLDSILSPYGKTLHKIKIIGAASPEGSVRLNYNLSDHRAQSILYRLSSTADINDKNIETDFIGRDWTHLLEYAKRDSNVPYKKETINLLEMIVDRVDSTKHESENNHNLQLLKDLKGGVPYRYLYINIFPTLRASRIYLNYLTLPIFEYTADIPYMIAPAPRVNEEYVFSLLPTTPRKSRNFYMALKTNMLYDIALLPSISAEFYLGKDFSAVANWTYGWWDKNSSHRYWRAYGGDIALRWWFGKAAHLKPLTGHHIGVYGGITTYDFEFGNTGYMGGLPGETLWNRCLRTVGLEYGYSLPIARRLNIDFTLGLGYLGGKYIKYKPSGDVYLWQSTHKINWFGPTKAEISLTWLIGNGNYNSLKGKGGKL